MLKYPKKVDELFILDLLKINALNNKKVFSSE